MRYLEDFEDGFTGVFGAYEVTKEEIVDFAQAYDPQPFHTDEEAARKTQFGGLIASGWHICAIAMRLLVDYVISDTATIASPGIDEIRWKAPLRPGDVVRLRWTILEVRRSRSKPDRGIVRALTEMLNQNDEVVMTHIGVSILHARPKTA